MINTKPNRYAEMSVIGAITIDETYFAKVIDKIRIEEFSCDDLREIYKSILDLGVYELKRRRKSY